MSPFNGLFGQQTGRTAARAPSQEQAQPAWGQQQPPQDQWQPAQPAAQAPVGYPQQDYAQGQGYAAPAGNQDHRYPPQQASQGPDPHYANAQASSSNPHAPQFEPYVAPAPQQAQRPQGYPQAQPAYAPQYQGQQYEPQSQGHGAHGHGGSHAQAAQQWPAPLQQDPRGFDLGGYAPQAQQPVQQAAYRQLETHNEPAYADWNPAQPGTAGGFQNEHDHQSADLGFAQPAGGELDPAYGEEEPQDYEVEEPRRGRRTMMIAAALAGAVIVGGGMAYGYKTFLGRPGAGDPPVIKTASEPSKIKPADAGGKQFAHSDSKIMGRLGDGTAAPGGEVDAAGTRKVSTVVVGRDGSIQAPAAVPAGDTPGSVAVPGMTVVDGFGGNKAAAPAAAVVASAAQEVAAPQKLVVNPPAAVQKPIAVAKVAQALAAAPPPVVAQPAATGSIEQPAVKAAAAAPKKTLKKVAQAAVVADAGVATDATPPPVSVATSGGGNGFVAVLASVPRSDSSRLDALKRFADMQQKYGTVLGGKTPDVAEANLGAKGAYHRLVVGPPGSREQASSVCSQLKSQGYADCWVTSY